MKKLKWLLFLPLLMLLVACGAKTSPKETFISYMKAYNAQEQMAYDYTLKIDDVVLGDAAEGTVSDADLKKAKLSFHIQQDLKAHLFQLSTDLSAFSADLPPIEIIYDDDKMYANAELMAGFSSLDVSQVKGKYIDLAEFSGQEIPALSEAANSAKTADVSWLKEVDEANFTEKDGKVTASFTVSELVKLLTSAAKTELTEEMTTYIKQAEASISESSKITYTLDEQGNGLAKLDLVMAKGADKMLKSIKATMDFKKAEFKAIKSPASAAILKQADLAKLMGTDELGTATTKLTDEEFDLLYEEIEKEMGNMTKDEFETLLAILKSNVTEAQYKKLESLSAQAAS